MNARRFISDKRARQFRTWLHCSVLRLSRTSGQRVLHEKRTAADAKLAIAPAMAIRSVGRTLRPLCSNLLPSSLRASAPPLAAEASRPVKPLSTTTTPADDAQTPPRPAESSSRRDSMILERFRLRQRGGSPEPTRSEPPPTRPPPPGERSGGEEVLSGFGPLGLSGEVVEAAEGMGAFVPSEIQCVGIPAILKGQSVVLSSPSGSGRTLAYLLPLVQMLRRDSALFGTERDSPRALLLCSSGESCDKVFSMASFITSHAQVKSSEKCSGDGSEGKGGSPNAPIGLLVGTPEEVLQQIEEGDVMTTAVKYLVLDEADIMLDAGLFPKIQKISSHLKNFAVESNSQHFQAVLVISPISKILEKHAVERLEHDRAGKVAAMLLEIDLKEVLYLIESRDALRKKVADAVESLHVAS
ncbi:DEAD-box ATP-dependent RNA helicase 39 [Eucalyptus grandis]|uniref:DEAD-box ATP-dependent RNA helicase 39 n=1 Tax=Eucalyptus grandis TaxID=71139 RepID=UPI00192EAFAE|nr:DEAD-box ATP-dependent RNA helicase 39 [Eucalyptus grandis]